MELRPYVDDGKHWVLYTDGACVREPIDKQRIEHYRLTIRPVVDAAEDEMPGDPNGAVVHAGCRVQRNGNGIV